MTAQKSIKSKKSFMEVDLCSGGTPFKVVEKLPVALPLLSGKSGVERFLSFSCQGLRLRDQLLSKWQKFKIYLKRRK